MVDSGPPDAVGPWKRAHIRSLNQLCRDAINLGEPEPELGVGLFAAAARWHREHPRESGYRPNPYSDIADAKRALHKHPIYSWLQQREPPVLREMPHNDPAAEFRFVQVLLRFMTFAFAESNQAAVPRKRTDKTRKIAWGVFDRAEQYLLDGTAVLLPNSARHNLLTELLGEAKSELMRPSQRAPRVGEETYWILETLAYQLYKDFGLADVPLIMAVAQAVGPGCSEKTARRYVQRAKLP
jgi:hypothetical protein